MSLLRARIIKADASVSTVAHGSDRPGANANDVGSMGRRIPAPMVDALAEAALIRREAHTKAESIVAAAAFTARAAAEEAARDARERELARVTAELLAARVGQEHKAERKLDHTIHLATALAERLIGETLAIDPARIRALAVGALHETRGARQLRIEASDADLPALKELLSSLGEGVATLEASNELSRGSLIVHTELGRIDARLAPQLGRLAEALREVLRGKNTPP